MGLESLDASGDIAFFVALLVDEIVLEPAFLHGGHRGHVLDLVAEIPDLAQDMRIPLGGREKPMLVMEDMLGQVGRHPGLVWDVFHDELEGPFFFAGHALGRIRRKVHEVALGAFGTRLELTIAARGDRRCKVLAANWAGHGFWNGIMGGFKFSHTG